MSEQSEIPWWGPLYVWAITRLVVGTGVLTALALLGTWVWGMVQIHTDSAALETLQSREFVQDPLGVMVDPILHLMTGAALPVILFAAFALGELVFRLGGGGDE